MIGRLTGVLAEKQPPFLLIDVNGVGYEVQAPMTSIYQLPALGERVTLFTHFSVSENAQQLFAFKDKDDRLLFRHLIKVSGVGPKLGLAILSGMEANEFVQAVLNGESTRLVKIPGVGKKTAERLVVEMQDRLKDWSVAPTESSQDTSASENPGQQGLSQNDMIAEAESALVALGYKPTEAAKVIARVCKEHTPSRSEELIRLALKSMLPA
ncbi:Holliday junction branch migration protein RuvA [Sessilibacter corallicola]|uniref:Holliday junction branch migration protein RuvA n=1 Tax=Sessilibacter corallicola TaxID=2904075 RepID=UPI001E305571|nr:Holliday junction branch migration protein RuvA [Sessilibacter corallicola]MCE2028817.1 Holliday junction branch migration protein RuvA [Sessilibacter corallicola]